MVFEDFHGFFFFKISIIFSSFLRFSPIFLHFSEFFKLSHYFSSIPFYFLWSFVILWFSVTISSRFPFYYCFLPTHFVGTLGDPQNKDASYETAVASEKRDSKEHFNHNENDTNGSTKYCDDYADDDMTLNGSDDNDQSSQLSCSPPTSNGNGGAQRQTLFTSTPEKDKRRRASSTWHTKLERRRRKNSTNPSISITMVDDKDIDDSTEDSIASMPDSPPIEYTRQKRHSWWNIFVPDNIKQR